MTEKVPILPRLLTYAGILPFVILSLGVILASNDPMDIYVGYSATGLFVYGLAIFIFLNGIRWGIGVLQSPPDDLNIGGSILAFFAAWFFFIIGLGPVANDHAGWPMLCFAFLFVVHYVWDLQAMTHGQIPRWFLRQRLIATIGAALSLAAAGTILIMTA